MQLAARAVLALAAAALAAGCTQRTEPLPPAEPAPPQRVELEWIEHAPADGPGLVFEVRRFAVTVDGWEADVAVRNESAVAWELAAETRTFGLMLFASGELDELERRNRDNSLPGLREARAIDPPPPALLRPGQRWAGTISAPGSLASGRWVRLVFGTLAARGDPPAELPAELVWITDRAYELR